MNAQRSTEAQPEMTAGTASDVRIPCGGEFLYGDLVIPHGAHGIVLFAHGSGSSRHSSRNKAVACHLHGHGIGTLLLDLLTQEEEKIDSVTAHLRFDIPFLSRRLVQATEWLERGKTVQSLPLGYFGASTGAAAALTAAAHMPRISAVVSRGGRPDLAGNSLPRVTCPTLLIVGGNDRQVEDLNRKAMSAMNCIRELVVIPGATHLFEEPGALEQVAGLASGWFLRHFKGMKESRSANGKGGV